MESWVADEMSWTISGGEGGGKRVCADAGARSNDIDFKLQRPVGWWISQMHAGLDFNCPKHGYRLIDAEGFYT